MSNLGERIRSYRQQANLSQTELAAKVGVSYAQIGRYETKGAQPPAEVLQKMAGVFRVSLDQLASGSLAEQAAGQLTDQQLLKLFSAIQELPEEDKQTVKRLIDAFVAKKKIQELANS
jgi:transcriptional regulator with XRE-family HTH domain